MIPKLPLQSSKKQRKVYLGITTLQANHNKAIPNWKAGMRLSYAITLNCLFLDRLLCNYFKLRTTNYEPLKKEWDSDYEAVMCTVSYYACFCVWESKLTVSLSKCTLRLALQSVQMAKCKLISLEHVKNKGTNQGFKCRGVECLVRFKHQHVRRENKNHYNAH